MARLSLILMILVSHSVLALESWEEIYVTSVIPVLMSHIEGYCVDGDLDKAGSTIESLAAIESEQIDAALVELTNYDVGERNIAYVEAQLEARGSAVTNLLGTELRRSCKAKTCCVTQSLRNLRIERLLQVSQSRASLIVTDDKP